MYSFILENNWCEVAVYYQTRQRKYNLALYKNLTLAMMSSLTDSLLLLWRGGYILNIVIILNQALLH